MRTGNTVPEVDGKAESKVFPDLPSGLARLVAFALLLPGTDHLSRSQPPYRLLDVRACCPCCHDRDRCVTTKHLAPALARIVMHPNFEPPDIFPRINSLQGRSSGSPVATTVDEAIRRQQLRDTTSLYLAIVEVLIMWSSEAPQWQLPPQRIRCTLRSTFKYLHLTRVFQAANELFLSSLH